MTTTCNSNRPSNQEIGFSSKNPEAKESYISKNNNPLKKVSRIKERKPEEQNKLPSLNSENLQEPEEEPDALCIKDANKTKLIRSCFNITNPSEAVNDSPEGVTQQRHTEKKSRGKYPKLKIKVLMAAVSLPSRIARLETSSGNPE
jgi:hypothetical protein